MTREEVLTGLEDMIRTSDTEKQARILSCAVMFIDGKKQKALWEDKKYKCPICGMELVPSYMKECPECHIKVFYKKGGS